MRPQLQTTSDALVITVVETDVFSRRFYRHVRNSSVRTRRLSASGPRSGGSVVWPEDEEVNGARRLTAGDSAGGCCQRRRHHQFWHSIHRQHAAGCLLRMPEEIEAVIARRSQHSQEYKDSRQRCFQCFCDSWPWPMTTWPQNKRIST